MTPLIKKKNLFVTIVSYVFHPLIMPTLGVLIIFNSGSMLSLINPGAQLYVLSLVFAFTFALPALILPVFYYLHLTGNFQASERNERIFPIAITAVAYYFAYSFLKEQQLLVIVALFILTTDVVLIILLLVNFFWKISLHMTGIGGICGLSLFLALQVSSINAWFFILALVVAGVIAHARLKLQEHTPGQLVAGFLLGATSVFAMFVLALHAAK